MVLTDKKSKKIISIAKPSIDKEEIQNVTKVLTSGQLAQGKIVEDFERKFAEYVGVKYAVATNSGTSALHTSLASLGVKSGDEIMELLLKLNEDHGTTLIIVTHDPEIAEQTQRVITIRDGCISDD